jgi:hypothetical protein
VSDAKLYVITRADLRPGSQIAQACHGLRQFVEEHPAIDENWFKTSNYIAVLAAPDEAALIRLRDRALSREIACSEFREPDMDDSVTCVVLEPGDDARRLCSNIPLALRDCQ